MGLIEIVNELNAELCENNLFLYTELGVQYTYKTNGDVEIIEFLGTDIYNSDRRYPFHL